MKEIENFFVRARCGEENGVFVEEWAVGWRGGAYHEMMMTRIFFENDIVGGVLVDLHD